jgi:hypothetical protein
VIAKASSLGIMRSSLRWTGQTMAMMNSAKASGAMTLLARKDAAAIMITAMMAIHTS